MGQSEIEKLRKSFGDLWKYSPHRIMGRLLLTFDRKGMEQGCRAAVIYAIITETQLGHALALAKEMGWGMK